MKRSVIIYIISIFMIFSLSACGFGGTEEKDSEYKTALMNHYKNNDFYFTYDNDHYTFRLPKFWEGKYITSVSEGREDFYQASSYEEDGSGLLFSIYEYKDESYKNELENYTYLAYDKYYKLHYVMVIPEGEEVSEENKEEYDELSGAMDIIIDTFAPFIQM